MVDMWVEDVLRHDSSCRSVVSSWLTLYDRAFPNSVPSPVAKSKSFGANCGALTFAGLIPLVIK
jgi:hypothetical protein